MNIYISTLAIPIPYLPYISVSFCGVLTDLNVSTVVQFEVLVNIIVGKWSDLYFPVLVPHWSFTGERSHSFAAAGTGISPLFYYRMDGLLPKGHFLNKNLFRVAFYTFVYGFCQIIPIPLIGIAFAYQDQNQLKQTELNELRVYFEDFLNEKVIVAKIGWDNPFVILIFLLMVGACVLAVICILFCVVFIYYIVNKSTKTMSNKTRKMQRNSLIALISLVSPASALGGSDMSTRILTGRTGPARTRPLSTIATTLIIERQLR